MIIGVYTPELSEKTRLTLITDYHYKKYYYSIGEFSLTVLDKDPGNPRLRISNGDFLYVWDSDSEDDYLIVTAKKYSNGKWTISGYDCKFILNYRYSLFPTKELEAGTYGYDSRKGYTGDILKEYIDYNLCEATDPNRKVDFCYCTTEKNIGFADDTFMSRLQPLDEIAEKLCAPSGIGYNVFIDPTELRIGINIYQGADRTNGGHAFGTYFGDSEMSIISDNTAEKTTIWAVNGTSADDSTVTAVHISDNSGLSRKEGVVTINCETKEVEIYAKKAAEDMTATEEYDVTASGEGYPTLYNVGDVVMCIGSDVGQFMARIIFIEKNYSGNSRRIKAGLSAYETPRRAGKVLNKLSSETKKLLKEVIDEKLSKPPSTENEEDKEEDTTNKAVGNLIIIDHAPTAEDLTGEDCVIVQYNPEGTPAVTGTASLLFNAAAVFVEIKNTGEEDEEDKEDPEEGFDEAYVCSSAGEIIITMTEPSYGDRSIVKSNAGIAYCAYYITKTDWIRPVVIAETESAVQYYNTFGDEVLSCQGSFEYNGKTLYYNTQGGASFRYTNATVSGGRHKLSEYYEDSAEGELDASKYLAEIVYGTEV